MLKKKDIESLHAKEKRAQSFIKEDMTAAIGNLQSLIKREKNDEILAIHGRGNYLLSPVYKDVKRPRHVWHSWTPQRSDDHLKTIREHVGRKPGDHRRQRNAVPPKIIVDRNETPQVSTNNEQIQKYFFCRSSCVK